MLIKEEGYIHDVIRRSNPKTMLCLKSYGRSNQYSMPSNLPQLKTVDPKIKLQALAVERNQKNRLYQSQASYENGRFLDFLDVALGPPLSKDHCRENTFSKTFHESGTFTDTTLGAEERRRAKYEQGCVERHERRHERQLNLEHARKQLWIKKIERKHTREVRRLEQHRVNAAALHIQTVARGKNARTYVKNVREAHQRHESAVIIQERVRRQQQIDKAKSELTQRKDARRAKRAALVTRAVRNFSSYLKARQTLEDRREEFQLGKQQAIAQLRRTNSARVIQAHVRGLLTRRNMSEH